MKKPTFKRQKALLALIGLFGGELSKLELQKYMFLYVNEFSDDAHYGFVPYHYGFFSYELYRDLNTLERNGFLQSGDHDINALYGNYLEFTDKDEQENLKSFFLTYKDLKGDELIGYIYNKYPYFAINSKISDKFISSQKLQNYKPNKDHTALYTIGYEGVKFEEYLNNLIKEDIKILVDVRKNAFSMKYGFSKKTLQNAVEKLGMKYIHMPTLGIESENRKTLNTKEDYEALFSLYKKTLKDKFADLEHLSDLVNANQRVAITCFEKDVSYCHRGVIAETINKIFGIGVQHI